MNADAWVGAALLLSALALAATLVVTRVTLRRLRRHSQLTLESIGDGVLTTGPDGRIRFANAASVRLTGWPAAAAVGRPLGEVLDVVEERQREPLAARWLAPAGRDALPWSGEATLFTRDRRELAVECTAAPLRSEGGTTGLVVVFRDVTELRMLNDRLAWQASHDALTGLCNRTVVEQEVGAALEAAREGDRPSALLYLDLDQFKVINDTCGHAGGDELLRRLAQLLLGQLRGGDLLARMGGDEFAVVMRGAGLDAALGAAASLCEAVGEFRFEWEERQHPVRASVGVVLIDAAMPDVTEVLRRADMACQVAKESGRGRVHAYTAGDADLARRHEEMAWVTRLIEALDDGRLVPLFQPIVPVDPARRHGLHLEVLLRLVDEQGRTVAPGLFMPAAEKYGVMQALDRWVVRRVLGWLAASPARAEAVEACAINLSGQSLSDPSFVEYVLTELDHSGARADRLCFEITETVAIANLGHARAFLRALKARGCRFSLDDFGSGMSSFGYLRELPVDYLKVDGSFVRTAAHDPLSRAVLNAVASMAHVLGVQTIAEFVEDEAILAELRAARIDYAQGYLVGRPQPLDELLPPVAVPDRGAGPAAPAGAGSAA